MVKGNKEAEFRENSDSTVTDVSFHCDVTINTPVNSKDGQKKKTYTNKIIADH